MNTHRKLYAPSLASRNGLQSRALYYYLAVISTLCLFAVNTDKASAQGYGQSGILGYGGMGAGGGGSNGGNMSSTGSGSYYGSQMVNSDHSMLNGNHEMLRNDMDFENYLLLKRTAFAQQMQQNEVTEDKLRAYAEKRLKALAAKGATLTAGEQAESHDLMDWLKKDADQRANNLAWLKRQDTEIAMVEQDQDMSFKNQRNALHNMFEDNQKIESQWKWNQQMQLANLHQQQENNGSLYGAHQPYANSGLNGTAGFNGLGYGGYGGRWGW